MKKLFRILALALAMVLAFPSGAIADVIGAGIGAIGTVASETKEETTAEPETTAPEESTVVSNETEAGPVIAGVATMMTPTKSMDEEPPLIKALAARLSGHSGIYKDIAFTTVENYVNIRTEPSSESAVVGKIYNQCAAKIEGSTENNEGTWYKIHSGTCNGYVLASLFVTGKDAEELAPQVSTLYATIKTDTLRLRKEASLESETVTLLAADEKYVVVDEIGDFLKLQLDADMSGYVYSEYVQLSVSYKEAISLEEEQAELKRQAELEKKRREAEEAAKKAAEAAKKKKSTSSSSSSSSSSSGKKNNYSGAIGSSGKSSSEERRALCNYAESWVGCTPYVSGGTSLTNGADCSGFLKTIFSKWGISLPRTSGEMRSSGREVSASDVRMGDIVCYDGHVAVYIGDGMVCHCSSANSNPNTKISSWNYRTVLSIRNVFGD